MAGNSAIWRDNNMEASSSDKIEFNTGSVPDNTSSITQTEIQITSAIAINEKPKGNLNEIQDTAADGVTYIITGSVKNRSNSAAPTTVKKWLFEDKTVTTTFPFGRFGIRLDDFPAYNVRPNAQRGLILYDWRWIQEGEYRGHSTFIAILRLNASSTGLNSPTYNWNTT